MSVREVLPPDMQVFWLLPQRRSHTRRAGCPAGRRCRTRWLFMRATQPRRRYARNAAQASRRAAQRALRAHHHAHVRRRASRCQESCSWRRGRTPSPAARAFRPPALVSTRASRTACSPTRRSAGLADRARCRQSSSSSLGGTRPDLDPDPDPNPNPNRNPNLTSTLRASPSLALTRWNEEMHIPDELTPSGFGMVRGLGSGIGLGC